MASLTFSKASVLFPTTKTPEHTQGIGANFVMRNGRPYVASLNALSLKLREGDRVAIVGLNGSGKSTLLRLASGIYLPNEGKVTIEGRPATLFSATIGLSVDESAEKNIRDGATLMNIPADQIDDLIDEIIEFAELKKFAHLPMRIYSSGMRARMGFGLATSHNADILLIDEVFGTGDTQFYQKAKERLERKMEQASILLLASHSEFVIREFCNKVLWMHKGQMVEFGDIDTVLPKYSKYTHSPG